ncbi:YcjF family protein [Alteromonas sp. S005]|uniref:YcjF family protein n=1 Tax=Alteromonas sp. S005 TaxID=3117400 RepID=UPI002FE079E1
MSDKPYKFDEVPEPGSSSDISNSPSSSISRSERSEALYGENSNQQDETSTQSQKASQGEQNSSVVNKPKYKTKVKTQTLDIAQPETKLPQQVGEDVWEVEAKKDGFSLGAATLGFGVVSLIGFFVFEAYTTLAANVYEHPIGTGVLSALLVGFVSCFSFLSFKEWRGYKQVNTAMEDASVIRDLLAFKREPSAGKKPSADMPSSPQEIDRVLTQHGKRFSRGSYAAHCFERYQQQLQDDMTGPERLGLYEDAVLKPVQEKAHKVLNKESVTAGSLAFISPNNLIQTFAVVWISFRTIRRMARVYGLRPSTVGNWKLLKVLAQNIAAQGVFDLATDEVANQIGGSLSAKFMENSAEAIAAGALNARLGRALIKLLK